MKKKFLLGLTVTLCSALLLTGCGGSSDSKKTNNSIVCTATIEENGSTYKGELTAYFDDKDKVVDAAVTMTFSTEEEAQQMYALYNGFIQLAKQYAEEGETIPDIKIKVDGKKLIIENYADFASSSGEENLLGLTKAEFTKKMDEGDEEGTKWSCK